MFTIETLPVDETRRLTGDDKRSLSKQLAIVLESNQSLSESRRAHERSQLIRAYRKEVGLDALISKRDKLRAAVSRAEGEISDLGFSVDYNGNVSFSEHSQPKEGRPAWKRLKDALTAIQSQPDILYRSKVLARLQLCSTVGEALVVMNEVMGNGIMPTPKLLVN